MKKFFSLFALVLCAVALSQKIGIPAKIVFADGSVSESKILFRKSSFYKDELYENSITQKHIVLINGINKREKRLFNEFRQIEFVDLKGKNRTFQRPLEKFGLFELVQDGPKMKWYRDFTENAYDHSQGSYDIFIRNDGEYGFLNMLTNYKKKLKELTSDNSGLAEVIDNCNFFNNTNPCLQKMFNKYNE
ncbi:hypothetical protein FIC_01909 [Flavobacteriaceae bacterium 3519-10]|nr:hypothetical protein FIC_01909 [Flavobacteriaceae bacterium 3519-10]